MCMAKAKPISICRIAKNSRANITVGMSMGIMSNSMTMSAISIIAVMSIGFGLRRCFGDGFRVCIWSCLRISFPLLKETRSCKC